MTTVRTVSQSGWSGLFWRAFRSSGNAMILLDSERRHVDVNGAYLALVGYPRDSLIGRPVYDPFATGPLGTDDEWRAVLRREQFTGVAEFVCADGRHVNAEFAGHPEVVTEEHLILVVILRTTRRAHRLDQANTPEEPYSLSGRELEVVRLVASGLSGPEIAISLSVSHHTVRNHVSNATSKLGAR